MTENQEDNPEQGLQTQSTNTGLEAKAEQDKRKEFVASLERFTEKLNAAPNPKKILKHQNYEYIPISAIEKDLDKMYFGLVQYEVISYQQIFNEIVCHARIRVFHPTIQQWLNYDGMGSAVIQQDAETKVSDFAFHKKANAMQLAAPRSFAEAIKNAAKKIGKRFGSDINRKFEDTYEPFTKEKKEVVDLDVKVITALINDAKTLEEMDKIKPVLKDDNLDFFNQKYMDLGEALEREKNVNQEN